MSEDAEKSVQGTTETELAKLLEDERKRSEEYLTKMKYLQADFENYRKRTEKEFMEAGEASVRDLVTKLVTVLDELELAVANAKKTGDAALVAGLEMVNKNLRLALEVEGLKSIEAVGKPFDPTMEEAVEKVAGGEEGKGIVLEEVRKGFTFRDRLIRASMVRVGSAGSEGKEVSRDE